MRVKIISVPEGCNLPIHEITFLLAKTVMEYQSGEVKIKNGNYDDLVKLVEVGIIVERIPE